MLLFNWLDLSYLELHALCSYSTEMNCTKITGHHESSYVILLSMLAIIFSLRIVIRRERQYKGFIITECLKEQQLNNLWSSNKMFVQRETEKCSYKNQLCSLDTEMKYPHFSLQQGVFINVWIKAYRFEHLLILLLYTLNWGFICIWKI